MSLSLAYAEAFPGKGEPYYWASLWPSSIALAEHLLAREDLPGLRTLELGCGCGLAGIAAGLRGAHVTVTDNQPAALELATDNWRRNGLQPAALQPLDWRDPPPDGGYELILGADILYHPPVFPDLARCITELLEPGGSILLAEPGRPCAHAFFGRMLQAGYQTEVTHHEVLCGGATHEIAVIRLR